MQSAGTTSLVGVRPDRSVHSQILLSGESDSIRLIRVIQSLLVIAAIKPIEMWYIKSAILLPDSKWLVGGCEKAAKKVVCRP